MQLYPAVSRSHRKITRFLRERYGACRDFGESLRRICSSKIETYRALAEWQPRSFVYQGWGPKTESWLNSVASDYIIFKPPRGSCGRGISVHRRRDLRAGVIDHPISGPMILQEYSPSRTIFDGDGRPHMGCIRHIAHIFCTGSSLGFIHLPSYWRVAPEPVSEAPEKRSFTANISSGALPFPLEARETETVRSAAAAVALALTQKLRRGQPCGMGPVGSVEPDGSVRWDGAGQPPFSLPLPPAVDKMRTLSISKDVGKNNKESRPVMTSEKESGPQEPRPLKGLERRRHIRLSLMGLARITIRGGESQDVYMSCIGRGGAGLYMHDETKSGQLVVLELTLTEDGKEMEMKFAARVRYSVKLSRLYMVGLQFEKMGEDRYAILLKHLKLMKDLQL